MVKESRKKQMKKTNKNFEEKINAKKRYGQNFLTDSTFVDKIKEELKKNNPKLVFEIGPGTGILTRELLQVAQFVDCVEIDRDFEKPLEQLKKEFEGKLNVHFQDISESKIEDILTYKNEKYDVYANIPYYLTTEIITKLIENRQYFKDIFLTVQKEAGERICAKEGSRESGAITHFVEYYAERKLLFKIPKTAFTPEPKVDSAFIHLALREKSNFDIPFEKIKPIVKITFEQRRKTLKNSLKSIVENPDEILKKVGIDEKARPENLSLNDFYNIAKEIQK